MHQKKTFYTEAAYFVGLLVLAVGTALMEKADFGMSMVVAPAYILHLKISETLPFFTFGMAEYTLQAVILILLCLLLHRPRLSYLFSFVTALIYGFLLDGVLYLFSFVPAEGVWARLACFLAGMVLCSLGVSFLFHTYIAPEAYELFVKELARKHPDKIHRIKTAYDVTSCAVAVVLSFCFFGFGHFEGVKYGTIFCALVNGWVIGRCTKWLETRFVFRDKWTIRPLFERE